MSRRKIKNLWDYRWEKEFEELQKYSIFNERPRKRKKL